jgi:UV DNA damage endonuclease
MYLRHLGYACKNVTLGLDTGRSFRLASLTPERVRDTVAMNLDALEAILRWNVQQNIRFLRVSSDVVPFASHPASSFDWEAAFAERLAEIRDYAAAEGVRLSMHPGQFTVLSSPRPEVVEAALADLDWQARFMHALDPDEGTLTLHAGGAYGDKPSALERFAYNFRRLSPLAQRMLILENDDKVYHADDVLPLCERLGVPMVFDFFHHRVFHADGRREAGLLDVLARVVDTWGERVPKFHLSSAKEGGPRTAHADLVLEADLQAALDLMAQVGGDRPFDVMLEAKQKDCAVLPLVGFQQAHLAPSP